MPASADGRCFTNYMASCQYDSTIQRKFNVPNNQTFRLFLQRNMGQAYEESRKLHVCSLNPRFTDAVSASGAPVKSLT